MNKTYKIPVCDCYFTAYSEFLTNQLYALHGISIVIVTLMDLT